LDYGNTIAPKADSPQHFCEGAVVANLQAEGIGIVWYDADGNLLDGTEELENGVYYAAQKTEGECAGERTMVTVVLTNAAVYEVPNLPDEIEMCLPATLADVPTNGNTNLVWFYNPTGGSELDPLTIDLTGDIVFYVSYKYGDGACFSIPRVAVHIITVSNIGAPDMEDPQHFCPGAMVST